ncbi:uncharacterized protein LOC114527399 [Dendronephthya gigantea]|uniref:uncharacterized protein LOC114527399 n=1 Tax=Dendronephthya gigantea TaxID=151771 RepID=UPI00106B3010|nr:uncharacterized protein LOC114527399 [Dendronephthya gigantea]
MELVKLNLEQIKRRQTLEREEQELRRKRELMEAQMEAEKAIVSYQVASEFEDEHLPTTEVDVPLLPKKEQTDQQKIIPNLAETPGTKPVPSQSYHQEIVGALRHVVNSPRIEYLRFNGDPLRYVTFIRNFEVCLEKDNPDQERKLQLLIQHCVGKAREVIESCINLENGYKVAKETLKLNFGKLHIIAEAHVKKLMTLPDLKTVDGPSLLEFARHLTTAERTLIGMGSEYTADLNYMSTLRELVKKLSMFLRAKWTEQAGKLMESGRRPSYGELVKFVQERAWLVDNEFGSDMAKVSGTRKRLKETRRRMATVTDPL